MVTTCCEVPEAKQQKLLHKPDITFSDLPTSSRSTVQQQLQSGAYQNVPLHEYEKDVDMP